MTDPISDVDVWSDRCGARSIDLHPCDAALQIIHLLPGDELLHDHRQLEEILYQLPARQTTYDHIHTSPDLLRKEILPALRECAIYAAMCRCR
jgi:hypothetical protein